MLSVSEQLQNYRAMKAREGHQSMAIPARTTNAIVLYRHPKTKEFFQTLMQRWYKNYNRRNMMVAKTRTTVHS